MIHHSQFRFEPTVRPPKRPTDGPFEKNKEAIHDSAPSLFLLISASSFFIRWWMDSAVPCLV